MRLLWPAFYLALAGLSLWQFAAGKHDVEDIHLYVAGAGLVGFAMLDLAASKSTRQR
jgi:hypothetical protein